jgi:hypothetical protein
MADLTVVGATAITAAAGVGGAWIGLLAGRQQISAEDRRQRWLEGQRRRDERKEAYRTAIDLIADWYWDMSYPPPDYHVVRVFTKPFVHAANAVRVYGSDRALQAVDRFQRGLNKLNELQDEPDPSQEAITAVWDPIDEAFRDLFEAAREDVGPSAADFAPLAEDARAAVRVPLPRRR